MKRVALLVCLLVALMTIACSKQEQTPQEKADAATDAVEEKADAAAEAVKVEADAATEAVKVEAAAATEAVAAAPETVVIEASYGNVTLSHQMHAEAFGCVSCHGEGTPGALDLGKEKAHEVCKGCHLDKAAGPTKCTGCHVKS